MKLSVLVVLCSALAVLGGRVSYANSHQALEQVAMSSMRGGMMGGMRSNGGNSASVNKSGPLGVYIQSNGLSCISCHAVSGNSVGPAFTDIARRYAGQAGAEDNLAESIANGVSERWKGYPPMPAGLASKAQAKELARLILDLAR
ncbi:MAG: c-type cytochrome [Paralcaligenes sp.]